ncbi:histidine kinase [Dactylosporangium sp. NPDC000244]|uniref:sensor histidine kinase n=1 Tax=Dactylosporangium sp. NPDC000244 TaxID=3154365 RepID=UPI0033261E73
MTRWWERLPDSVGAGGLLVVALVPGMSGIGADLPEFPDRPLDALGWFLVVALCAPLAIRRRWPAACAVLTAAPFGLYQCLGYAHSAATLGFPFALYALGAHQSRRRAVLPVVLTVAYAGLTVLLHRMGSGQNVVQYAEFGALLAAFWLAGRWMRHQRAAAERHRRDSMALAAAAERAVIARELHDVVTHHVTAMVLQADAAAMALDMGTPLTRDRPTPTANASAPTSDAPELANSGQAHTNHDRAHSHYGQVPTDSGPIIADGEPATADPTSANDGPALSNGGRSSADDGPSFTNGGLALIGDSLASVAGTGRQALVELRHLLRVLDADEDDPSTRPVLGRIADLVERTRTLGQPVDWREEGIALPTGGGVGLTVYRVVQESLTNAVKYAHGRPTRVRIAHSDDRVAVEVHTDGSTVVDNGATRTGRGLAGLRERVNVFGGDFEAGPTPTGGFLIRASIPTGVRT